MAAVSDRVVTVFGGTRFVGGRIVRHLRLHDFRDTQRDGNGTTDTHCRSDG